MDIGLERSGETAVLRAGGRLTAPAAGKLREALLEAFAGAQRVELALAGVEEADLTFVQLVCAARRTAAERGIALWVSGLEAQPLERLLRESGAAGAGECFVGWLPPSLASSGPQRIADSGAGESEP